MCFSKKNKKMSKMVTELQPAGEFQDMHYVRVIQRTPKFTEICKPVENGGKLKIPIFNGELSPDGDKHDMECTVTIKDAYKLSLKFNNKNNDDNLTLDNEVSLSQLQDEKDNNKEISTLYFTYIKIKPFVNEKNIRRR